MLIGVPLAMLVLGLIVLALLAGMPFGRDDRIERAEAPRVEPITEGDPPQGSNSRELVVAGEPPPTSTTAPIPPSTTSAAPPLAVEPAGMSQSDAVAAIRDYVVSRADYGVSSDCVDVTPIEYRNRGYTVSVSDRCDGESLGRWRIDALTREIYQQKADGRFLRP